MISRNDILNKLRELKPTLRREYSVKEIGLFGSYESGSATDDSDIDLLIELDKPIGWKFFFFFFYLEQTFGRKIDLVTKSALRERLKEEILSKVNFV